MKQLLSISVVYFLLLSAAPAQNLDLQRELNQMNEQLREWMQQVEQSFDPQHFRSVDTFFIKEFGTDRLFGKDWQPFSNDEFQKFFDDVDRLFKEHFGSENFEKRQESPFENREPLIPSPDKLDDSGKPRQQIREPSPKRRQTQTL